MGLTVTIMRDIKLWNGVEADIRLIASAPELLDTLTHAEAVMSIVEPRSEKAQYLHCLNRIRAAIAKATEPRP